MWKASSHVLSADSVLVGVGGVRVDSNLSFSCGDGSEEVWAGRLVGSMLETGMESRFLEYVRYGFLMKVCYYVGLAQLCRAVQCV